MPKSPNLDMISETFKQIKEKLDTKIKISRIPKKIYYTLLFYPVLVLSILIYIKPKIILDHDRSVILSKKESYKISYSKLMLWFILLQLPLVFYVLLSNLDI